MLAFVTYGGLFFATWTYALLLQRYQEHLFPRWTWLTVAFGVLLCIGAAALQCALVWPYSGWQRGIGEVLRAFVIGGLPIVLWKLSEDQGRIQRRIAFYRNLAHERSTEAVAQRGSGESAVRVDAPEIE